MISSDELYTSEQLAELRELRVPFNTFRETLLMNDNMQPFVMNLILYSSAFFEVLLVVVSFLAACLPYVLFIGLICSRKPSFCRALIMHLTAKTCFYFWNDASLFAVNQKFYICTMDGVLKEKSGLSEQGFLVSVFFTYLVLSTLMSMSNFMCHNIIQRMNFAFYAMIAGAIFLFILYLAKIHLMQSSQTVIITSIELGMGFAIVFLILMIGINFWPIRLTTCFDSLPEEEILLNHLCMKWDIDTELPKLEKMTQIKLKLDNVLKIKADMDQ